MVSRFLMTGKDRYRHVKSSQTSRKEDRPLIFSGVLGVTTNAENQVEVNGRPGFVWVRLRNQLNELIQAFNESVAPVFDLPVLVEYDKANPIRYKVISRDVGRYTVWVTTNAAGDTVPSTSAYLPAHGSSHSFNKLTGVGGGDVVWVYSDQFIPWLVTPSGSSGANSVSVQPSAYYYDDQFRWAGGTGIAGFDTLRPTGSSNARMLLVYLDPDTGTPFLATGSLTEFANTITGTAEIMPYMPSLIEPTDIPLAGVRLITGSSVLLWQNLYDLRDYFAHSSTSGSSGGGGAPTDAEYVVMSADATLSDERVLTAGTDIDIADGGAGGNATVSIPTGTFERPGHAHFVINEIPIYEDGVFQATGTILDFTNNMDVAVTGTSVFISSTGGGGGGSTVLIYEDGAFQVTGSAINFESQLEVHVTGSTAHVKIPDNTFSEPGHTHFSASITDLQHAIPIFEDSVFQATGTIIDFGENVNVVVTGSVVFVSTVDTQGGGGGGDLLIYDDGAFKVTGTSIDFEDGLTVDVTGSSAFINSSFSIPVGIGVQVYNTGTSITAASVETLSFDQEVYDTDGIHSGSSSQLYCNTAGKYLATFQGVLDFTPIDIAADGAWIEHSSRGRVAQESIYNKRSFTISKIIDLEVGDYLLVKVFSQSVSGNLIYASGNEYSPFFSMQLIEVGDQDNTLQIYDDSVFVATGTAISFDEGLDVVSTGTTAYVSYQDIGARVYSTGSSAINNQFTAINFHNENYDTDNIHSGTSTQLYCNTAGKYLIIGHAAIAGNAGGAIRFLSIRLNESGTSSSGRIAQTQGVINASVGAQMVVSTTYDLNAGDYVELVAFQDSGSDLNINFQSDFSPYFMMQKIG
jgi:hypothetical protein